jgi:molybdopterin-guanine dinucleotide biosynthesis adapter protein
MPPMISIVGKTQSGKTTLIEKLIPELKKRGYKIGTVKHAYHAFDMDKEGKDSWRHKAAGADTVIVASPGKIAMVKDENTEDLDAVEKYFDDMDLVIIEGFKRKNRPKIEIFRTVRNNEPLCRDNPDLIALVTDSDVDLNVPTFGLEDIEALADLIENKYMVVRLSTDKK